MPYQLPPDLEGQCMMRVSTGEYPDVEHVLRDALTALDVRNREIAAIQEGLDAVERGEVRDFDAFCHEFSSEHGISSPP
jgi:Arc/MetJ-type ribon-helix-helix transcriptional regulator